MDRDTSWSLYAVAVVHARTKTRHDRNGNRLPALIVRRSRGWRSWREMPEELGAWRTVYDRFTQWRRHALEREISGSRCPAGGSCSGRADANVIDLHCKAERRRERRGWGPVGGHVSCTQPNDPHVVARRPWLPESR
ncbi:hypothetical protein DKM19_31485 [Streptosporangium sp. 'caverna']|nr:hypothetical protein DKM19_31485 [Streptosporangium sp. 'caverna']